MEALEGVGADEQREVRELLDELGVVLAFVHQDLGDTEEQRGVGATGTDGEPVVRASRRRAVFGRDDDDLAAPLHELIEEVRLRHLVLDEILAALNVEPRQSKIVKVAVRCLKTVDIGMSRGLVAMPSVIRPLAAALGFVGSDSSNVAVQKSEHLAKTIHAVLSDDAKQTHAASVLEALRPGMVHRLEHLRRIALRSEPLVADVAAVGFRDGDHAARGVIKCLVPTQPDEGVEPASGEVVLLAKLLGQVGEPVVGPPLPALAHHRVLEPIRAIDSAMQREPLGTASWMPVGGGRVPLQVGVAIDVVVLLGPDDDSVPGERPHPAGVGVVGRAHVGERIVVRVLIAINVLPAAVRIVIEGVLDALHSLE
ncbi:MAG: hypothetical protein CNCCGFBP_02177 [Fimbriimonadaceae bacterium]|nr:hypothetical protein [Fimbriimonadaceae bacterium]